MYNEYKDARHVAYGRFADKSFARWSPWLAGGLLILGAVIALASIIIAVNNRPKLPPYPIYTIPSKYIQPDSDITIMYDNGWYVVKDYTLIKTREAEVISKTFTDKSQDYWQIPILIIAGIIGCSSLVVIGIYEYKQRVYIERFMQKWSDTKEYPVM
jgi:hypothetical protein